MTKNGVVQRIKDVGVIPVVRATSTNEALEAVEALRAGGLSVLEITMTVPNAVQLIEQLARACGDEAVIGAGSVRDAEVARACQAAGARFIVSPMFDPGTVAFCAKQGLAVMPGALTPTEIAAAWQAGADLVKVFPVSALGGAGYVRAVKTPMPHIELVPTGGVTLETVDSFIRAGASAVGVGSELIDRNALRRGQPEKITEAARAFVEAVRMARQPPALRRVAP